VENASLRPLIIERPDLQTLTERYGYASITLVCWLLWLYLVVPLLALIAWAFGATLVYQTLIQGLEPQALLQLLVTYGSGVTGLLAVYLAWAISSYLRFRGVERRRTAALTSPAELAASHRLTAPALERLRAVQRVVLPVEDLQRMFADESTADAFFPAVLAEPAADPSEQTPTPEEIVAGAIAP
jgi:poly-beta-1,6-N-acetyl-D-glucosamine biosynthesis protein PgaD